MPGTDPGSVGIRTPSSHLDPFFPSSLHISEFSPQKRAFRQLLLLPYKICFRADLLRHHLQRLCLLLALLLLLKTISLTSTSSPTQSLDEMSTFFSSSATPVVAVPAAVAPAKTRGAAHRRGAIWDLFPEVADAAAASPRAGKAVFGSSDGGSSRTFFSAREYSYSRAVGSTAESTAAARGSVSSSGPGKSASFVVVSSVTTLTAATAGSGSAIPPSSRPSAFSPGPRCPPQAKLGNRVRPSPATSSSGPTWSTRGLGSEPWTAREPYSVWANPDNSIDLEAGGEKARGPRLTWWSIALHTILVWLTGLWAAMAAFYDAHHHTIARDLCTAGKAIWGGVMWIFGHAIGLVASLPGRFQGAMDSEYWGVVIVGWMNTSVSLFLEFVVAGLIGACCSIR